MTSDALANAQQVAGVVQGWDIGKPYQKKNCVRDRSKDYFR
jgi:hypothetical protein